MSHIVEIKTRLHDLEAIKATARRLGGEFHEGKTTFKWWGKYLGDSELQEHLRGKTDAELSACDHAISFTKKEGHSTFYDFELGIVSNSDRTYSIRWDYFDAGLCQIMGGEGAGKFLQAYAAEKARIEARKQGLRYQEQTRPTGEIVVTLTPK